MEHMTSPINCQVCGEQISINDEVCCEQCRTPHHRDCWNYTGICSTYGCGCSTSLVRKPDGSLVLDNCNLMSSEIDLSKETTGERNQVEKTTVESLLGTFPFVLATYSSIIIATMLAAISPARYAAIMDLLIPAGGFFFLGYTILWLVNDFSKPCDESEEEDVKRSKSGKKVNYFDRDKDANGSIPALSLLIQIPVTLLVVSSVSPLAALVILGGLGAVTLLGLSAKKKKEPNLPRIESKKDGESAA